VVLAAGIAILASAVAAATPAVQQAKPETATGGSTSTTPSSASPPGSAASAPRVVRVERKMPPRRKVVRRRFRPSARPGPARVREIIRIEARRWHIAAAGLARRVACESHFHWWAGNGPYQGLLQFSSSTFYRGLRTIRTRAVRLVRKRARTAYETRVIHYSDGRVERKRGKRHRQVVVRVYRGTIPRRPSVTHAWAQLRIGAQAIRGMSGVHSSEWSCPA
jgi:hypothetical protein